MMKIAVAASILALSTGYCAAQTTTTNPALTNPAPAATTPAPKEATNPAPKEMVNASQKLISDIYDQNIYDKNENKIGKIDNLVIDEEGKIGSAIVAVGGFLGIGEKDVAIPFSDIKMVNRSGKNWLEADRSKDQLAAAPTFDLKPLKKM
jgi:sporulation protein YlmC with PRC-barrel domain